MPPAPALKWEQLSHLAPSQPAAVPQVTHCRPAQGTELPGHSAPFCCSCHNTEERTQNKIPAAVHSETSPVPFCLGLPCQPAGSLQHSRAALAEGRPGQGPPEPGRGAAGRLAALSRSPAAVLFLLGWALPHPRGSRGSRSRDTAAAPRGSGLPAGRERRPRTASHSRLCRNGERAFALASPLRQQLEKSFCFFTL